MTRSRTNSVKVPHKIVSIDCSRIRDTDTFHDTFAEILGFPAYYGRNMNAWIDCMTYVDDPGAGMTSVHAPQGGILVLQLEHVRDYMKGCREQHAALLDAVAFVNWRRIEQGEAPVLALSYHE